MPGNGGIWPTPVEPVADRGGWLSDFFGVVGGGAVAGFGLGDAASGMAGNGPQVSVPILDHVYEGAVDVIAGQYPGYGTLWTYDTQDGVGVTQEGWVAVAVAAVALWWVLK